MHFKKFLNANHIITSLKFLTVAVIFIIIPYYPSSSSNTTSSDNNTTSWLISSYGSLDMWTTHSSSNSSRRMLSESENIIVSFKWYVDRQIFFTDAPERKFVIFNSSNLTSSISHEEYEYVDFILTNPAWDQKNAIIADQYDNFAEIVLTSIHPCTELLSLDGNFTVSEYLRLMSCFEINATLLTANVNLQTGNGTLFIDNIFGFVNQNIFRPINTATRAVTSAANTATQAVTSGANTATEAIASGANTATEAVNSFVTNPGDDVANIQTQAQQVAKYLVSKAPSTVSNAQQLLLQATNVIQESAEAGAAYITDTANFRNAINKAELYLANTYINNWCPYTVKAAIYALIPDMTLQSIAGYELTANLCDVAEENKNIAIENACGPLETHNIGPFSLKSICKNFIELYLQKDVCPHTAFLIDLAINPIRDASYISEATIAYAALTVALQQSSQMICASSLFDYRISIGL